MANGRRSIYSRRQAQAPGSYDTPLADFLDAIPGYVNQYQQNKLQEQRYQDERDYRTERSRIADQRYNQEQLRLQQEREYNKNRQIKLDEAKVVKEQNDKDYRDTALILNALPPLQKLDYLINKDSADGKGTGNLNQLRDDYKLFNDELRDILNIQTAGNPKAIAEKQLKIKDFNVKHENNPLYTTDSNAFIEVNKINNKLSSRMSQVSTNGNVLPKYWEQVDARTGSTAKGLYDQLQDDIEALVQRKAQVDDLSTQKDLDAEIEEKIIKRKEIQNKFRLDTVASLESKRTRDLADQNIPSALSRLDTLLQMNPAGAQSMASAVSSIPSDIIPEEPAITDSEMADVSNQIAMNQKQVEDNLAIINEGIPGVDTISDVTVLTGDEAEAYNPNKVGLDSESPAIPASFLEPITEGGSEEPQDTESNFILDKVLPERARAEEAVDRDESSLPPFDLNLEDDMTTDEPVVEEGIKPVSEFKSSRDRNPSSIAFVLSGKKTSPVRKLFNLLSDYEKAEVSTLQGASKKRELKRINTSIQQLSKEISNKIGDFIDPQTGDFSDSNYTDIFYTQLSRNTGVPIDRLKDTLKRIAS